MSISSAKKETFEKLHGKSGSLISDGQNFPSKVLGREPSDLLCTKASSFKPLRDPSSVRSLKFYLSLSLVNQWRGFFCRRLIFSGRSVLFAKHWM